MTGVVSKGAQGLVLFLVLAFGVASWMVPLVQAQDAPASVYEVHGVVKDEAGAALDKADVALLSSNGTAVKNASTDASGKYAFSFLAAGSYKISASHSCCLSGSVDVTLGGTSLSGEAPAIQLNVKPPVESGDPVLLSGTVKDVATGGTLAGVSLDITSYWGDGESGCTPEVCYATPMHVQNFQISTDSKGEFSLNVNRGSANLRASLEEYDATHGSFDMPEDRSLDVPMRKTGDDAVRLFGILKSTTGAPIANGWVSAGPNYSYRGCTNFDPCMESPPAPPQSCQEVCWSYENSNSQWGSAETKSDGSWEIRVASGELLVQGSAQNFLEASQVVSTSAGDEKEVALALEPIPPDSVTIVGHVMDRESGKGIANADVGLENQKWGTWANARTSDDGRFEVRGKPGYNILTVSAYQNHYACPMPAKVYADSSSGDEVPSSTMSPMPCESGTREKDYLPAARSFSADENQELTMDFNLIPRPSPSSVFQGYVLNGTNKKAIPDAGVTFYNELTRDWGSATTDNDGSYKISVHAGYYSVRVWAPHYFDGVANLEIGNEETQRQDFVLQPGEKRYGYWGHGAYAVADKSWSPGPPSAGPRAPESAPMPSQGQRAYVGAGGGLGPYHELSAGGKSPTLSAAVAVLGLAGLAVLLRRRNED